MPKRKPNMKTHLMKLIFSTVAMLTLVVGGATSAKAQDPLPSWNDGPAKQAILAFVKEVTDNNSNPKYQLHLRDSWKPALDCSDLLRSKACRARDRCCRRSPHREPSTEKRSDVDVGGGSIYRDIFSPRPSPVDHHQ